MFRNPNKFCRERYKKEFKPLINYENFYIYRLLNFNSPESATESSSLHKHVE